MIHRRKVDETDYGPLTFKRLAQLEPRLLDLVTEARSYHSDPNPNFCANAVWYGHGDPKNGLKYRLSCLVGRGSEIGGLQATSRAYDLAYDTIYRALPDCRGRCHCSAILDALLPRHPK
jgi:hypothetical protein